MFAHSSSAVVSSWPDGTDRTVLGSLGPVSALGWADTFPGGPEDMAATVKTSPGIVQPKALAAGRIVECYRGALAQYEGILNQPTPGEDGTWQITAKGAGTYGDNFRDIWSTWTDVNDALGQAKTRGLRWQLTTYSNTNLYLVDQQESGTESITDRLNLATKPGYWGWHVGRRNLLSIAAIPVTPTRILFSSSPAARTLSGFYNALYARYQISADNTDAGTAASNGLALATSTVSIAKHGRIEKVWDITGAGTLSAGVAGNWAAAALSRYQAASWAGPIPITYGQYTTMTGVPVDIGCEHAGEVAQLVLADGPYDAELTASPPVTFPVGKLSWDETSETGGVEPLNAVATSLDDLLESMAIWLPRPAVTS